MKNKPKKKPLKGILSKIGKKKKKIKNISEIEKPIKSKDSDLEDDDMNDEYNNAAVTNMNENDEDEAIVE
jgi:hypothetical protein